MYSTVQYSTVQYSTIQYSTVQYSTVQYSTVQYSTVQYSTVQYSTVQYITVILYEEYREGKGADNSVRRPDDDAPSYNFLSSPLTPPTFLSIRFISSLTLIPPISSFSPSFHVFLLSSHPSVSANLPSYRREALIF